MWAALPFKQQENWEWRVSVHITDLAILYLSDSGQRYGTYNVRTFYTHQNFVIIQDDVHLVARRNGAMTLDWRFGVPVITLINSHNCMGNLSWRVSTTEHFTVPWCFGFESNGWWPVIGVCWSSYVTDVLCPTCLFDVLMFETNRVPCLPMLQVCGKDWDPVSSWLVPWLPCSGSFTTRSRWHSACLAPHPPRNQRAWSASDWLPRLLRPPDLIWLFITTSVWIELTKRRYLTIPL